MNTTHNQLLCGLILGAVLSVSALCDPAQIEVVTSPQFQAVFAGEARHIEVVFRNSGDQPATANLRARLYQTTTATAVLTGERPWKKLQLLAGQTVVEAAPVDFPLVKAETPFLVQWMEGTNKVLGVTKVMVYPPDLLKELKPLMDGDDGALGVFDPQGQIKPLLKNVKVGFVDLEDAGMEDFRGKLAIVGPFGAITQMRESLANQIQALVRKGIAVVWMQPPSDLRDPLKPSFYTVSEGKVAVVIVQAALVSKLPESPQSQINLIQFARLALNPEPVHLPHLRP